VREKNRNATSTCSTNEEGGDEGVRLTSDVHNWLLIRASRGRPTTVQTRAVSEARVRRASAASLLEACVGSGKSTVRRAAMLCSPATCRCKTKLWLAA
jgi:hypothetical protein